MPQHSRTRQQSAAIRDRMSAEVHKRLNAGLTAWAAGVLLVLLQAISVQNTALTASLGIAGGSTLLLSSTAYAISKGGLPLPNPKNLIFGVASLFLPRTLTSAAYSLLSVLLGIKAVMLFGTFPGAASPLFSAVNSEVTTLLFRLSGASALLAAVAAFCLRDAAEQHRLDMPTSRMLNLGLATMAVAQAAVLAVGVHSGVVLAGPMLNVMLGTCLCGCVWCASKYSA